VPKKIKMKITIIAEYDVPKKDAKKLYGTNDPKKMAKIDEQNSIDDLLDIANIVKYTVEPC